MTLIRRTALRTAFVVAMGATVWCAWSLPDAGGLALGAAVIVMLTACAYAVGSRHLALYAVGAALVLIALLVGAAAIPVADVSAAGLCTSMFSPGAAAAEVPQPVADRCGAVRRQHGIVVGVLGAVGMAVMLSALRPTRTAHAADAW